MPTPLLQEVRSITKNRVIRMVALLAIVISMVIAIKHGMAHYHAERSDLASAKQSLIWDRSQPDALYNLALARMEEDPEEAADLLREAIHARPVHAESIVALSGLDNIDPAIADRLMEIAVSFNPSHADILIAASKLQAERGNDARAIALWSDALIANPDTGKHLFTRFASVAEEPTTRHLLKEIIKNRPPWWEDFFQVLARTARSAQSLQFVFAEREKNKTHPPTVSERHAFIQRLLGEGLATQAYLIWMEGLSEEEMRHLGLIYNGGFEMESSNIGFDWMIHPSESTQASTTITSVGARGKKALRVVFRGFSGYYHHVWQRLFLEPGDYRMKGWVRIDSLRTQGGLRWVARCRLDDSWRELGSSYSFIGMSEWQSFVIDFTVPPMCTEHEIRLISDNYQRGNRFTGTLWFDDFQLRRLTPR